MAGSQREALRLGPTAPPFPHRSTAEEELGYMAHRPDGDRIAYTLIENDLDIWVLENLVAVLTGTGGRR